MCTITTYVHIKLAVWRRAIRKTKTELVQLGTDMYSVHLLVLLNNQQNTAILILKIT